MPSIPQNHASIHQVVQSGFAEGKYLCSKRSHAVDKVESFVGWKLNCEENLLR